MVEAAARRRRIKERKRKRRKRREEKRGRKEGKWVRPYSPENTASRPIREVKQVQAGPVLGWETTWEPSVLYSFCSPLFSSLLAPSSFLLLLPRLGLAWLGLAWLVIV